MHGLRSRAAVNQSNKQWTRSIGLCFSVCCTMILDNSRSSKGKQLHKWLLYYGTTTTSNHSSARNRQFPACSCFPGKGVIPCAGVAKRVGPRLRELCRQGQKVHSGQDENSTPLSTPVPVLHRTDFVQWKWIWAAKPTIPWGLTSARGCTRGCRNRLNTSDQNPNRKFLIQLLRCLQRRYFIQRAC